MRDGCVASSMVIVCLGAASAAAGCSLIVPNPADFTADLIDAGQDAGSSTDAGMDSTVPRDAEPDAARDDGGVDAGDCPGGCTGSTPHCDATRMTCAQCLDARHCDDGNVCTIDRCNLDGTCSSSSLGEGCIAEVEAGSNFTCVRRATGSVVCWGRNDNGELGRGGASGALSNPPGEVMGLADAVHLSVGQQHACAVRTSGAVVCWGVNRSGQLGDGSSGACDSGFPTSDLPRPVTGVSDAVHVAAGQSHSCALRSTGEVVCWGLDVFGQLGTGAIGDCSIAPVGVVGLTDAVQIAAGGHSTCAVRATGEVACWGANTRGQLGNDSTTDSPVPVRVLDLTDAAEVAVGASHACARRVGAEVACWGWNNRGLLGTGSMIDSARPVPVPGLTEVASISIGAFSSHTCALRDRGQVLCWGLNSSGQLGNGASGIDEHSTSPVPVGLPAATLVGLGSSQTCARLATGELYCWGSNIRGELGDGTTEGRPWPTMVAGL